MTSLETSPFDLTGRRILISGAAGGIGSATARLCAKQGAQLVLVDIVDVETIRARVGAEVSKSAEIFGLDTGSRPDVEQFARSIGPVYGLIDTAGIAPLDHWMDEDWDEALERVFRVNIKGPINLTRAFFGGMVEQKEGRIVLCGSVSGWIGGIQTGPHYAISKGGIHAFVRWLSRHGAPHNVLANGIAPGLVETGMTAGKGYDPLLSPLKRMAKAEEIAAAAVFLCGAGAGFASGAIFDINGAMHFH